MVGDNNIPEMNLEKKYSSEKPAIPQNTSEAQKEMEKTKKELDKLKSFIIKKFKFTKALGILPGQSIKFFIDEEEVPKESEQFIHLYMIIPEDKHKEIPKIMKEIIPELEKVKSKQKVWLQVKTPVDIWESCFDQKFEISAAISMAYPLYDTGLLESLRVAEIHKSLVLQKFEKYVVSYVIGGSMIRGDVTKESDVDTIVIINDTDVRRMSRIELIERLRGFVYQYIGEAAAMAGVDANKLNVQVYLLTDFWDSVKDANPVMFTFIRDGIPIYDRGTFMPWKALLKMGKLKPTPEAIDMFMKAGERTKEAVDRRMLDAMIDIYWSVVTPSQALLMLAGSPPPAPKHLVKEMEEHFYKNEKLLEKKYVDILAKVVGLYKDYEHQKIKTVSGKEIDTLVKESEDYIKKLKSLRTQIEKKASEKTIEQVYEDLLRLLKNILGNKSQSQLVEMFENELVKEGKFTNQHLRILKDIIKIKQDFKKGKLDLKKTDAARRDASLVINGLIEYSQRKELACLDKKRIVLQYDKDKKAELLVFEDKSFLFLGNIIKKITDKIEDSNMEEVSKSAEEQKIKEHAILKPKSLELVKSVIGNFEILL
jgi:predicted nucleotidyltransferase/uncharacterized protein (UPF0332 family)